MANATITVHLYAGLANAWLEGCLVALTVLGPMLDEAGRDAFIDTAERVAVRMVLMRIGRGRWRFVSAD